MTELRSEVGALLSQATLRYSTVWEDDRLLHGGLQVGPADDVLCICSAGDNVLSLALAGPRSVTAVDMNPAQSALLELKLAAYRHLDHAGLVELVGVAPGDPLARYCAVRDHLPETAAAFWDSHEELLAAGVCFSGRLERYILGFARTQLSGLWSADMLERLVQTTSVEDQAALVRQECLTDAFRERFAWYFGREQMAANGRDPAQFRHVQDGDVGGYFLRRFTWALTSTRLVDNFYLRAFLGGGFGPLEAGPAWLRPGSFAALRDAADRIRVHTGEAEQLLASGATFSKGAFSDMFEYMSEPLARDVLSGLARAFRPGGRLAWWCLLVPRPVPQELRAGLEPLEELSASLWAADRSWFYRSFHVARVR